jgi:hypothetical protein
MGLFSSKNQNVEQAVERAQFAVRELTNSKVSNQRYFDRIDQLRDVGADELADQLEQGRGR